MNRRTVGLVASVIGSAIGAWWWSRHRMQGSVSAGQARRRDQGEVIFDNTPAASEPGVM